MSQSAKQQAAKDAVHEIANHVYADKYPADTDPLARATDNPETVLDRVETAMERIWTFAEAEGLDNVLEKENAPKPSAVRERYKSKLIDYRYDDDGEFDDYAFDEMWNEVMGYYEVVAELVDVRDTGF